MTARETEIRRPRVVYLTWGETPRTIGVYGSQVLEQISYLSSLHGLGKIKLIAALPLAHSGLVREKLGYLREIARIRKGVGDVEVDFLPIYAPQTFFYSNRSQFRYFHAISNRHLLTKLRSWLPDIVHCRSYHATFAALSARRMGGLRYEVVFDARGLFPEEAALRWRLSCANADYRFLKRIESDLLREADVTIAVSEPMARHYRALGVEDCRTVYLSAPVNELSRTPRNRAARRTTTLCYVGALSEDTWHKPESLFNLYRFFRKCVSNPRLLIVSTSSKKDIMSGRGEIPRDEINIRAARSRAELAGFLSESDFGALSYFVPDSEMERTVASTVFAVKTAEYLSAGLPVLVNRFCAGAADLVSHYSVGVAYDPATGTEITRASLEALQMQPVADRAREVAQNLFDYSSNAMRYRDLYVELMVKRASRVPDLSTC